MNKTNKLQEMPAKRQAKPKQVGLTWFLFLLLFVQVNSTCVSASSRQETANLQARQAKPTNTHDDHLSDPMEACYLANNRASESLTISESTPVGTVVGEIMVSSCDHFTSGNHLQVTFDRSGVSVCLFVHRESK